MFETNRAVKIINFDASINSIKFFLDIMFTVKIKKMITTWSIMHRDFGLSDFKFNCMWSITRDEIAELGWWWQQWVVMHYLNISDKNQIDYVIVK